MQRTDRRVGSRRAECPGLFNWFLVIRLCLTSHYPHRHCHRRHHHHHNNYWFHQHHCNHSCYVHLSILSSMVEILLLSIWQKCHFFWRWWWWWWWWWWQWWWWCQWWWWWRQAWVGDDQKGVAREPPSLCPKYPPLCSAFLHCALILLFFTVLNCSTVVYHPSSANNTPHCFVNVMLLNKYQEK